MASLYNNEFVYSTKTKNCKLLINNYLILEATKTFYSLLGNTT